MPTSRDMAQQVVRKRRVEGPLPLRDAAKDRAKDQQSAVAAAKSVSTDARYDDAKKQRNYVGLEANYQKRGAARRYRAMQDMANSSSPRAPGRAPSRTVGSRGKVN